jgi:membrane dipeptidase
MTLKLTPAQDDRARSIHQEAIIITCHDHIPPAADLEQLKQGGLTTQQVHFSVDSKIDAPSREAYLASLYEFDGWCKYALLNLDGILNTIETHPDELLLVRTPDDIVRAKREGKVGILLGIEGGKPIEGRVDLLRILYRLGLRHVQPTWAYTNQLATGETEIEGDEIGGYAFTEHVKPRAPGTRVTGLTEAGRAAVAEMNRLGIIIDVDHLSRPAMRETIALSTKPLLSGHNAAKALANRLSNFTDAEICAIADKGGVLGLHFMTHKLTGTMRPQATLEDVVRQIDYIVNLAGIDILGLGPDYIYDLDGTFARNSGQTELTFPEGLEDSGQLLNLTRALVAHGYADDAIKKILGGNLLRLFREVSA